MKYTHLYGLWALLYILTAALGFAQPLMPWEQALMTALAAGFFLPPFLLLRKASAEGRLEHTRTVRGLSILSLVLTAGLLAANLVSARWSEAVGSALHGALVICSAPMSCSRRWGLSIFLWACLLMTSLGKKKRSAN